MKSWFLLIFNTNLLYLFSLYIQGYSRKGSALSFMSRDTEALECYEEGLAIDPNSEILKNAANDVRTLLKR